VEVPNLKDYSKYSGSGVVKHVSVPVILNFKPIDSYTSQYDDLKHPTTI